ncbi:MAG: hypothetical protein DRO36_06520 [Candidatus Hecatellales archaeon]|nr:MAG: hypothetical protein DRO36_06520 [Candidatus Hecatellales archaeon]
MKFYCPKCEKEVEVTPELNLAHYRTFRCKECKTEIKAWELGYKFRKKKQDPTQCPFCGSFHTHEVDRKMIQDIWENRITVVKRRRCDNCKKYYSTFWSEKLTYLYYPELKVIEELERMHKELEKFVTYEWDNKVWLVQKIKRRRRKPLKLLLSERLNMKVEVLVPNKIWDSLPFRWVSNQLWKIFGWRPWKLDEETKWLVTHGVKFPRKIRASKETWKIILINRGYGASEEERQKNTEELKLTLKKIFLYFPTRRLFAEWLNKFYWSSWKLSQCERELNRLGIIKLGFGHSLNKEQKKKLYKVAEEVLIKKTISDINNYLQRKRVEKEIVEALIDYLLPKYPKQLGSSPQQEQAIKKELRKQRKK